MKIHIFARHCKFSSNSLGKPRPNWFTREGCFVNMLNTMDKDCELTVCFDGTLSGSGHFLEGGKYKEKFNIIERKGGNDGASFLNMIEYVNTLQIKDDDVVYFVEDDYLHTQSWTKILRDGFQNIAVDYITLYDHNDKYFYPMYEDLLSKIVCTNLTHWRNVPNTTNTYACFMKTFKRDFHIHKMFCDLSRGFTRDFDKFAHFLSEGKSLINPIPGHSTHCEPQYMSPIVDWESIFKKTSIHE